MAPRPCGVRLDPTRREELTPERGEGPTEERVGRELAVVRLAPVARAAVDADLDLGRDAEVGFVEVFGGDVERGELGQGRGRAEAPALHVFDAVVGDQVLCCLGHAVDCDGEGLQKDKEK